MNVNVSEEEQLKVADEYDKYLDQFNAQLNTEGSYVYGSNLADASAQMEVPSLVVSSLSVFSYPLSLWSGTVLVIYYKQISKRLRETVNALLSCRKLV